MKKVIFLVCCLYVVPSFCSAKKLTNNLKKAELEAVVKKFQEDFGKKGSNYARLQGLVNQGTFSADQLRFELFEDIIKYLKINDPQFASSASRILQISKALLNTSLSIPIKKKKKSKKSKKVNKIEAAVAKIYNKNKKAEDIQVINAAINGNLIIPTYKPYPINMSIKEGIVENLVRLSEFNFKHKIASGADLSLEVVSKKLAEKLTGQFFFYDVHLIDQRTNKEIYIAADGTLTLSNTGIPFKGKWLAASREDCIDTVNKAIKSLKGFAKRNYYRDIFNDFIDTPAASYNPSTTVPAAVVSASVPIPNEVDQLLQLLRSL